MAKKENRPVRISMKRQMELESYKNFVSWFSLKSVYVTLPRINCSRVSCVKEVSCPSGSVVIIAIVIPPGVLIREMRGPRP